MKMQTFARIYSIYLPVGFINITLVISMIIYRFVYPFLAER
jgi:hypothetical protein